MPGGAMLAGPTVGPASVAPPGAEIKNGNSGCRFAFCIVRPDALTPTLSHREREKTLKTATQVAVLLLPTNLHRKHT